MARGKAGESILAMARVAPFAVANLRGASLRAENGSAEISRLASRAEGVTLAPRPAPASKPTPVARPLHPQIPRHGGRRLPRGGGVHRCHVVEAPDQHAHARAYCGLGT